MEPLPRDARLSRRAFWLIRLRWIAILGVILATVLARYWFGIQVHVAGIFSVAAILTVYNSVFYVLLNHAVKLDSERVQSTVHKIVSTQISIDLILLTVLLHFSGGIENPFMIYFIFHMVIASILLPAWESFLQAVLAVFLIVLLVLLEYEGHIAHHCLVGLVDRCIYSNGRLLSAIVFAFGTAIYMLIYMTSSISTQLRNQEEAYWEANIELKEKDKVKDEYVARVTHDIKGHLAAIQSCLEVVSNKTLGELNDRQVDFVGRAQSRTQTLATFVRTLLRLTQMRLDNRVEMQEFSLSDVVESVIGSTMARAKSKSVRLSSTVDDSVGGMVGDRFSIEEMLMNLILNAIKYTDAGGSVEVTASKSGGYYEVEVVDSGIGIPAKDLDHVFEEFYRASNAKKVERDGTGLGLSIVKQIVDRHGGEISVESRVGYGSTFRFNLPVKRAKM